MLFAFNGVITPTDTLHAAAWKRLFDEFLGSLERRNGRAIEPFDAVLDYVEHVDGRSRYEGVAAFLRSRGVDLEYGVADDPPSAETCCGLGNRKNSYFMSELLRHGAEVFPDAVAVIDAMRSAGKRIAVVSASENCTALLSRVGLLDRFDATVTGVEAAHWGLVGKPAPDTLLKAADLLGVAPAETVVFEDAVSGLQAARAGRFGLVVGVDRRGRPDLLSTGGAHLVLTDLREMLRPGPIQERVVPSPPLPVPVSPAARTFETILVHPPEGADAEAVDPALVGELGEFGVQVVVVRDDVVAACARLADELRERGVGSGMLLVIGPFATLDLPPGAKRAALVSVSYDPPRTSSSVSWIGGGVTAVNRLLREQLDRRRTRRVPSVDEDPEWTIELTGQDASAQHVHQTLLTVADSRFGTRGVREEEALGSLPRVLAAGIFDESVTPPTLLEGPIWTGLHFLRPVEAWRDRRVLDLRGGVLLREQPADPVPVRTFRFASLARPGSFGLRAEGPPDLLRAGGALVPPLGDGRFTRSQYGTVSTGETRGDAGGAIAAATEQRESDAHGYRVVQRLACFAADPDGADCRDQARAGLEEAERLGFDALLEEHRAAWAARWRDAEICIVGDPELTRAVRFSLFHLMASVPTRGEAAVGPRGVAGPSYRGHVMWDADVFVLPSMAATCPSAARAMLEYRIRRLGAARRLAADRGLRGARFPWESAGSGFDVTPAEDVNPNGTVVPIYTGEHEEHVVADVAWATLQYALWTGDGAFLRGEGRPLILDTARYWASRVRVEDGRGHIDDVIGPDEYHELVDDNVFTNVMARWNLRRAAELAESEGGVPAAEIAAWRRVADELVDGYDRATGRYEQFAGYYALTPLIISEHAETPVAADLLLGRERISSSQVIKQPDVLMLHHLVPEETADGSLTPNLEFYEPRCAHGSSLSPAIHAGLFARAHRPDDALRLFRMACVLDLENLTGTTAGGLHVANFGGVWQAIVFGFAGMRPRADALLVDPCVPSAWEELQVTVRYRDQRVRLAATPDSLHLRSDGPVRVQLPGAGTAVVTGEGRRWRRAGDRRDDGWEEVRT